MTDKLSVFNDALLLVGERSLSGLTENREPRHLLDQVWDNGAVDSCLEKGQWYFAMRSVLVDYDPAVSPEYGFTYAFEKGSDWILTSAICSDEYYRWPITRYTDENGYWFADETEIYVKYVSNDGSFGNDLSIWPISFKDYVSTYLASRIVMKVSGDKDKLVYLTGQDGNGGALARSLDFAKSKAAMALPSSFPARGSWVNARHRSRQQDGGNRNGPLIG